MLLCAFCVLVVKAPLVLWGQKFFPVCVANMSHVHGQLSSGADPHATALWY